MSSVGIRTSKLSFKGDPLSKTKKKSKKKKRTREDAEENDPQEGWVLIEGLEDVTGPITILSLATVTLSMCIVQEKDSKVVFQATATTSEDTDVQEPSLTDIEPQKANQVFVAKNLPDSTKYTFKSVYDRYLSCDKFGVVTCDTEAAGPTEEWSLVLKDDGVSFQSVFGTFLSVDSDGNLRGDADTIGFKQTFRVKCQASVKFSKKKKKKEEQDVQVADLEFDKLKNAQSFGARSVSNLTQGFRGLVDAKSSGKLHEELLNRRAKIKSDKFCK